MKSGGAAENQAGATDDGGADTTWVLVRQVPKRDDLGLNATITELRDLDAGERERIRAAEAVFDRFGAKWGHTEMVRRAMAFWDALDDLHLAQLRSFGAVNQADLERLRSVLLQFTDHITSWVAAGQQMTGEPGQVASFVAHSPDLQACLDLARDAARVTVSFARQQADSVVLVVMRQDERGAQMGDAYDAAALVNTTVKACEAFASAELVTAEADLLAAGRILLSLQAEIVYGFPALAPPLFDAAHARTLQLISIGVPKVAPVMYAMEVAAKRLAAWRAQSEADQAAPGGMSTDDTAAVTAASAVTAHDGRVGPAPNEVTETPVSDEGGPEATAPQPEVDHRDGQTNPPESHLQDTSPITWRPPLDLRGLFEEAVSVSGEAEQRWCEALGQKMAGDVDDLRQRMRSLLMGLSAEIQKTVAADTAGGLSPTLPALPLGSHDANALKLDPAGQQRASQHGVGLVDVIENLVRALEELDRPRAVQVQFPSGVATTLWSPDVFTRVREAAKLAIRFMEEPSADSAATKISMMDFGVTAWLAGLPEAAALYVICSLDPAVERYGPLAAAFNTLQSIVARLVAGTPVSLDALVPVTIFWLQEVERRAQADRRSGRDATP